MKLFHTKMHSVTEDESEFVKIVKELIYENKK
jgi:hypothetical protein